MIQREEGNRRLDIELFKFESSHVKMNGIVCA